MKNKFTLVLVGLLTHLFSTAQPQVDLVSYATGFNGAISDIAHTNDGRLFIAEQLGYIRIIQANGMVSPRPFLDIHTKVIPEEIDSVKEQGLLGVAFSPDYATSGNFYVHYTNKTGIGNVVLARYHVSNDPDSADIMSEEILLTVDKPYTNHNGGCLKFGPDGFLYMGIGDGGLGGDPLNRAQNPDSLLGKILRLDVSTPGSYSIPLTNPFANGSYGRPEIWALGLRNPWRFSFDRSTHNLWIGDVGEQMWEEINFQDASFPGGENYGWRCMEGTHTYNMAGCIAGTSVAPAYEYSHTSTNGCSVTGGYVYRGAAYPGLAGYYFYTDYCNGVIYSISTDGNFTNAVAGIFSNKHFTTFGENNSGELFVGDNESGTIFRITDKASAIETASNINGVMVYPTSNKGLFICEFTSDKSQAVEMVVYDIAGKAFLNENTICSAGKNVIPVNVGGAAVGVYILGLKTNTGLVTRRIAIQGN